MSYPDTDNLAALLLDDYEADVPIGWRATRHLTISAGRVQWGDHLVVLDAVTGVAWASRQHSINLTQVTTERLVRFQHPNGSLEIRFGHGAFGPANDPVQTEAFGRLLEAVTETVEPRLVDHTLNRLAAGATCQVANLALSAEGLHHNDRRKTITPWSASPVATLEDDRVTIRADHPRKGTHVAARRSTRVMNAGLLPTLVNQIVLGI